MKMWTSIQTELIFNLKADIAEKEVYFSFQMKMDTVLDMTVSITGLNMSKLVKINNSLFIGQKTWPDDLFWQYRNRKPQVSSKQMYLLSSYTDKNITLFNVYEILCIYTVI